MRSMRAVVIAVLSILAFVSCNRDPNVAKKRYLESGNKYFERGKFKEASIMYRNALRKDMRYGAAYYRLGLTDLKLGEMSQAVGQFRRAIELLPPEQPEHWDAMVKLSDLYLAYGRQQKQFLDDVDGFVKALLKRDPNSYDGHRLQGDLDFAQATEAYRSGQRDNAKTLLESSITEYRKADTLKPGQQAVSMQLARATAGDGNYAEAEKIYRGLIDKDKTFQPAYTELYRLYVVEGKLNDGEQLLKLGFQNNPKQYGFLTLLAAHYAAQKRKDDMVNVLQQIKSHVKDFEQAYLTVGDFYLRIGDGDDAIKSYREGIATDAAKKSTYEKRIIEVLMREGKRAEAAQMNSQILKENPKDVDAQGLAATFLLDQGDVEKALVQLQTVVTHAPDNPVARYNLGRAHAARREWEQARQQFQKAIELRPDYLLPRLALAQLQLSRGEFDSALQTTQAILQIDRGNVTARLLESSALVGQKKYAEAQALLDQMLKANPNSPEVLLQIGLTNLAQGKFSDADKAFAKSYQLNPSSLQGLMGRVQVALAQQKVDDALNLLQAESNKNPARTDLHRAMGNVAAASGRYDRAIAEFQKVLSIPGAPVAAQADTYLRLGEVYRRKGDLNNALQALQKARQDSPGNANVLSTTALVLDAAGRKDEAKQAYEATLKANPEDGVALNNLAYLIADRGGDLDQALTLATRAKQLLPNLSEVSDTLGWIYLKKNLNDNAIEIFKGLVAKQPNQSTYRYHLALALSQKGDKPNALKELQEALKDSPSQEEKQKIQEMISRLT
ncbi:MAG TPA: tetratricopeptide repeat protein [Bryobacteraceae bacterium]|nr:tetratricopeptide repeat protein [Bryobacteraceae bacterium]